METDKVAVPKERTEDKVIVWETDRGEVSLSVALVRMYFCPETSTVEAMTFLNICKFQKLNPWLREAYLIKYGTQPASIVVGKDTFTKRAERHPKFRGYTAGIIVAKKDQEGIEKRKGMFYRKDKEELLGGWALVPRDIDGELPVEIEVAFDEYVGKKIDGTINRQWSGKPATMIRKVALVQALRERFPEEFEGLYDEAEIRGDEKRPEEFTMPLSVAEAKAKNESSPVVEAESSPEGGKVATEPILVAMDTADDAELAAEAKAREEAEARAEKAPPVKVDRKAIWNAVLNRAKKQNMTTGAVLLALTAKANMPELSDVECAELKKRLEE